ncbi:caspase family protein [Paenibacillus elgii]
MAKGYSLHIGLNSVDPQHYSGWDGKLKACEADALDMEKISHALNYSNISTLLTANATLKNVTAEIKKAAEALESGDIFFLSYSGHGGQVPDLNNDESDGTDETWCLYDGQLLDDELSELWYVFKKDVRVIVLSDSCHSGTVTRARAYGLSLDTNFDVQKEIRYRYLPLDIATETFNQNKAYYTMKQQKTTSNNTNIQCTVKLISGCQDNQTSADGDINGLFTEKLLAVWDNGNFRGNYLDFYNKIKSLMPPIQTPNLYNIGASNPDFDNQSPFSIQSNTLPVDRNAKENVILSKG